MNKVIIIGYLAADPEFNSTQSGVSRCTFRVAVQRRFANAQGQRESDFFNCVAWRNQADFISRFFAKGSRIALEGTLQNRSYDAQDGSKRYITEIIVENAEFCKSKGAAPEGQAQPPRQASKPEPNRQMDMNEMQRQGFEEIDDDELPF